MTWRKKPIDKALSAVARLSNEAAHPKFVAIRWADNNGQPYCPKCGCVNV